jgi:hypothetical protein
MSETSQDSPATVIAGSGAVPPGEAREQGTQARPRHEHRKLRMLVAAGAVVAAAAGVMTALLAGSSDGPPSAFAALTGALAKTSAESYSFSLDSTATYAGKAENSDVVSGAYDPTHKLGTELLTGRSGQPSSPRSSARIRFIGEYVYTWIFPRAGFSTSGKPWDKAPLPPTAASVLPAGDFYGFATDWPVSPNELLAVVRSTTTVRDAGPASGPGWTGTRYTFTARLSPRMSVSGTADVDQQGQVRRLVTTTTRTGGVTTERDLTFSGFGAPVPVTAPPAAQAQNTDSVPWGFFF